MLVVWILVFVVSLVILVKGADVLLSSAEKIGLALGLSPFVVGVVIIGFGTSLPELASSIAGVWQGVSELVVANVVGSNIANILLIAGFAAIAGGRLTVAKNLVDLDIPMLAIATTFLVAVAYDGTVSPGESLCLLIAAGIYIFYTFAHKEEKVMRAETNIAMVGSLHDEEGRSALTTKDMLLFGIGLIALVFGARFLVDSVIALSGILGIGVGAISLIAVALGTSLPELVVSIRAGLAGKADVSLGNIFGSNVFNALAVVGLSGVFSNGLVVDEQTLSVGLPVMVVAVVLFLTSTLSNQVYKYEGAMFVLLYALFIAKVAGVL